MSRISPRATIYSHFILVLLNHHTSGRVPYCCSLGCQIRYRLIGYSMMWMLFKNLQKHGAVWQMLPIKLLLFITKFVFPTVDANLEQRGTWSDTLWSASTVVVTLTCMHGRDYIFHERHSHAFRDGPKVQYAKYQSSCRWKCNTKAMLREFFTMLAVEDTCTGMSSCPNCLNDNPMVITLDWLLFCMWDLQHLIQAGVPCWLC